MLKQFLLSSITKEMKIIRRLSNKVQPDKLGFRPKEGMRTTMELLQYLSVCGTSMFLCWNRTDGSDFKTYYSIIAEHSKTIGFDKFVSEMDSQVELINQLFSKFSEEDLFTKEVELYSGDKVMMGEAIINTPVKWLSAYKMQLFLYVKMFTEEKLGTPDLWRKTELTE